MTAGGHVKKILTILLIISTHVRPGMISHAIAYEMGKESSADNKEPKLMEFSSGNVCRCDIVDAGCQIRAPTNAGRWYDYVSFRAYVIMKCGAPKSATVIKVLYDDYNRAYIEWK